ncbi:Transcriptional regulatory protein fixJ [Serratia fonticola]|uniref:response regulator transcription factor n=1 Tax=Serratia fonticola TaxID=47917 RepID=UPI002179706D|nr:response regulator [Serratia fonticola]CAI1615055.1 Transcriptional regulatory protein fixJ [Serratia fonticola]
MSEQAYLVDDDPCVRDALVWLLEGAGITLTVFPSAQAFLQQAKLDQPGFVLLDICMPEMGGLALQEILMRSEHALSIIFLTGEADVPTTSKAFKNGAFDLLEKPVDAEILLRTIRDAQEVSRQKAQRLAKAVHLRNMLAKLTARERQIMLLVLAGHPNKVIAEQLYLALRTVEIHRHNMMKKMNCDNSLQLAQLLSN